MQNLLVVTAGSDSKPSLGRARQGRGSQRGSTLVEFAFAMTILLSLMMGIIEFGRFLYTYHFLSDVARDGTRYASVRGHTFAGASCTSTRPYACDATQANVTTYVQSLTPPGITATSLTVTTTWPGTNPDGTTAGCTTNTNSPGCYVEVQVSYPYKFVFPFLPSSATTWTISSTSEIVISQ